MPIRTKRAYETAARGDGRRFLVERLWPRGIKKTDLEIEAWLKDVAPSPELRQWYGHDPAKWLEFQRRYRRELDANAAARQPLQAAARRGTITLVYSARDEERNSAAVLRDYLNSRKAAKGKA